MTKQELLQELANALRAGEIAPAELFRLAAGGAATGDVFAVPRRHFSIAQVLAYVGALIVLVGVGVLIAENWAGLGSLLRVVVTLGAGAAAYASGALLYGYGGWRTTAYFAYVISAILFPFGLGVALDEMGWEVEEPAVYGLISGLSLALFLLTFWARRHNLFIGLSLFFGGLLYYSLITLVRQEIGFGLDIEIYTYATVVFGAALVLIGRGLESGRHAALTGPLHVIGLASALGAAVSLNGLWDAVSPFVIFAVIYLSIYLRSKIFLRLGAFFLMTYIIKVTSRYFGDNLGWPLALVLAGLLIIGVGYLTFHLNKRYLKK